MELNELDFTSVGSNQFPVAEDNKGPFRYAFWKEHYLTPAFIHILFSHSHYYLFDDGVNYIRNEFYSALDNLVDNLLVFLTEE